MQKGPYLVGVQYTYFTQKLGKAVANDTTLSTHEHSNHSWLSLFLFQVTQYTLPFWLLVSYLPEGMYIAQTSRFVFNRAVHLNIRWQSFTSSKSKLKFYNNSITKVVRSVEFFKTLSIVQSRWKQKMFPHCHYGQSLLCDVNATQTQSTCRQST